MYFPVSGWLAAFLLTVAVEVPIAVYLLRRFEPDLLRLSLLIIFANLATHPAVWFIFSQPFLVGTPEYTVVAELWAVGVEALFYAVVLRGLSPRRAIGVAVAANGASFLVGRLVVELRPELFR